MLTMLGSPRRCCDGITRRETLKAGALSALGGLSLVDLLQAEQQQPEASARGGKAKRVIVLYLLGGAATQDMWDLKPDAPSDIRTQFKPIPTTASGIEICELLPLTAKWMHRGAIVRSLNHKAGCHNTLPSYTGLEQPLSDITTTKDSYPPSMGSVCRYLAENVGQASRLPESQAGSLRHEAELPPYVYMPCYLGWGQNIRRPGPYGGFLGRRFDPLFTECAPYKDESAPNPLPGLPQLVRGIPFVADSTLPEQITLDRLNQRKSLLAQMDDEMRRMEATFAVAQHSRLKQQAYGILTSPATKAAFDVASEDPKLLDRYGRTLFGHSTLIGRRLVEAGVRFVNVTWDLFWDRIKIDYDAWDTHTKNFSILKDNKLPNLDQTLSALLEDLDARGLLDETLVVLTSEMGRTPKVNANGGRDHWTYCYSTVFFGGGIRGGTVYGASDAHAAYVKDKPVSTADICATIYHSLGISPDTTVPDRSGRPVGIGHGGQVIGEIVT
ncbi:MAG TPA: DUF1501 domain-containing protein [Pirellulaceae bacterium]|nr:DUF1501 domain-containing protein [Pirellulaceae bacterium]